MMNQLLISFVLSQIFGLYMVILAFVMFSRVDFYRKMLQKLDAQNTTILLCALIGLLIGMVLVGLHNIWSLKPSVAVTMVCWFILIVSILWLTIPERMLALYRKIFYGRGYYVATSLMMFFGLGFLARSVYNYAKQDDSWYVLHVIVKYLSPS